MTSEFRQDLVSGEWVLIASGRSRRPDAPEQERTIRERQDAVHCPFEDPQATEHGNPLLVFNEGNRVSWEGRFSGPWTTQVIRNKYPALMPGTCGDPVPSGPFLVHPAHGFHELVIFRPRDRGLAQFSDAELTELLTVYRERYQAIAQDDCGDYISIFHNWGPRAGATMAHPHSQILSTPVVPPEVMGSIRGADAYFREHGSTVHCRLIAWEVDQATRIIYEDDAFIAFCPYVSKTPYEVRIFPKQHSPNFEISDDAHIVDAAHVLGLVLRALYDTLGDPDYNFYIHTAPVAKSSEVNYDFYHWHIEIVPRLSVAAGFELSTAIYINTTDPDDAAAHLREQIRESHQPLVKAEG